MQQSPRIPLRSSKKKGLAVSQPKFDKIEAKSHGGMVTAGQRTDVITLDLLMDYELDGVQLRAGRTKIVVDGQSGITAWARKKYSFGGLDFVLCPEADVIAFTVEAQ